MVFTALRALATRGIPSRVLASAGQPIPDSKLDSRLRNINHIKMEALGMNSAHSISL